MNTNMPMFIFGVNQLDVDLYDNVKAFESTKETLEALSISGWFKEGILSLQGRIEPCLIVFGADKAKLVEHICSDYKQATYIGVDANGLGSVYNIQGDWRAEIGRWTLSGQTIPDQTEYDQYIKIGAEYYVFD